MKKQIIFIVIIFLIITLIHLFSENLKNDFLKEDKYCLSSDYILGYPVWDGNINNPVSDYVELTLSNSWREINNFEKFYKRIIDFKFFYENEIIILGEDRQSEILLIKYNILDGSQKEYLLPNYIKNSENAFIKLYEINNNFYLFGLSDVNKNDYNGEIVIYLAYYDFINDKFIEIDVTELNESLENNFYISNIVGDNDGNLFFIIDKNIYKIANNKNSIEVIELSENKKFDINFSQGKIIIYDDYLYILNKVINKNEISIKEHKYNLLKINLSNYEITEIGQVNFYDEANIHNLWFDQNNKHLWIDSNGWFDISEINSQWFNLIIPKEFLSPTTYGYVPSYYFGNTYRLLFDINNIFFSVERNVVMFDKDNQIWCKLAIFSHSNPLININNNLLYVFDNNILYFTDY